MKAGKAVGTSWPVTWAASDQYGGADVVAGPAGRHVAVLGLAGVSARLHALGRNRCCQGDSARGRWFMGCLLVVYAGMGSLSRYIDLPTCLFLLSPPFFTFSYFFLSSVFSFLFYLRFFHFLFYFNF